MLKINAAIYSRSKADLHLNIAKQKIQKAKSRSPMRAYQEPKDKEDKPPPQCKCVDLMEQVNTCIWHVFMTWFTRYRTNNMYHIRFFDLMHLIHTKASMRVMQAIYWKLNMLSKLQQIYFSINQNNVILRHLHISSLYITIRKVFNSLKNAIFKVIPNPLYKQLKISLGKSQRVPWI